MKTFLYYCRGVVAIMFLSSAFVLAQVESGQIAGTVADQSGAIITGANVSIKNVATGAARYHPDLFHWRLSGQRFGARFLSGDGEFR